MSAHGYRKNILENDKVLYILKMYAVFETWDFEKFWGLVKCFLYIKKQNKKLILFMYIKNGMSGQNDELNCYV